MYFITLDVITASRKFDFSTKNVSIFAHFDPEINSRTYTAIPYPRVKRFHSTERSTRGQKSIETRKS